MKIKLSIIIPAHNCEATLEQAIVSIYEGLSSQEAEQIQMITLNKWHKKWGTTILKSYLPIVNRERRKLATGG